MAINVSDKETRAVFMNFKELRSLEKNVQSLDIEQAYSISLINLDQKVMKTNYKKLKDKVTRIRSHLSNDEIDSMRRLEEDGRLNVTPSASKMDFNIRIAAAAKRLKLQPRAKTAHPRLESSLSMNGNGYTGARARRAPVRVREIPPTPRTPRTDRTNEGFRSNRASLEVPCSSNSGFVTHHRPNTPNRPISAVEDSMGGDFLVPRSVREERRKSIDIRCLNDIKNIANQAEKSHPPSKVPANNGHCPASSENYLKKEGQVHFGVEPEFKNNNGKSDTNGEAWVDKTSTFLQLPSESILKLAPEEEENIPKTVPTFGISMPYRSSSPKGSKPRPMSVPATKVTDFGSHLKKGRPMTAAQLAVEARQKSVEGIKRASSLLAEGKTRVPFSSHDLKAIEEKSKEAKPFRSIREGTFSVTVDKDVIDNTLGDDLHKEMKKGMLLGEVATSLCLEDKIDMFLDKVDTYIKENPNYVFDAEKTRAELVALREANKAKKKKPKRNKLRRRQLERRLTEMNENAMAEAAKARYLRLSDDKLDMSGVNTLVVDQMKMLQKLKAWEDDSD